MAVVNPKNFFGIDMSEMTKNMFRQKFMEEGANKGLSLPLRSVYAENYMRSSDENYLLSKAAIETIDQIKLSNPMAVFEMIIDKSDDNATILAGKNEFFRYYHEDDVGEDTICGMWAERVYTGTGAELEGQWIDDFYMNYETFRILKDDYSHPSKFVSGMHPKIIQFIKTLIFVKCSNVETYPMKPMQKVRPPQMDDNKWINKSGTEVTLVNADWNRMYIKSEGFKVRGHIRFQRHGKENKEIKLIWIDSYEKKGYQRTFHSD